MRIVIIFVLSFIGFSATAQQSVQIDGLNAPVEIIKDKWGISHIYAENQQDLFFAQGYNAARDRLFQFEIWRRKATGTLAEIMGEKALEHDKGARLLRFRNDLAAELAHYHEDGTEIINAFVDGVNAYIRETEKNPELLPFEFKTLGIKPGHWTPEIVISRHNALTGGISNEIMLSKAITALGADVVREYYPFYRDTHLKAFDGIDLSKITSDIMAGYRASRSMPAFDASDLANPEMAATINSSIDTFDEQFWNDPIEGINNIGSNNWVIDGSKTESGKPIMANDPHRTIQSPSLRYMVHLNAPAKDGKRGWNVIGGGEPVLPGVSIGHNEFGAWGLTIFRIDQEDLYVYETNPDNPNQYKYNGRWADMHTEETVINVRGQGDVTATLKYSIHGPVIHEDTENNIAYGLRAAWLDIGATPYLASLRMDQAETFEEFRDACSFSGLPGENMVWADKMGNIGWQSVGLTPVRFGWDGSLPIPGNGEYEWSGYVPIKQMPHVTNPKSGWYGTANHHNVPDGYPNIFSDFYSDPARYERLLEVMNAAENHTIEDSERLQYDNKSMNAEKIIPIISALSVPDELREAQNALGSWDARLDLESSAAAIFDIWEQAMLNMLYNQIMPRDKQSQVGMPSRQKLKDWILTPDAWVWGDSAETSRDHLMVTALQIAVEILTEDFGDDIDTWNYGRIHYSEIIHPLSHLLSDELQDQVNIAPLPRGGGGNTLNANHGNERQRSGASFRMIVDTADWDKAVGTNSPGQSGDPRSPHYADLFEGWNKGDYFPMLYSKTLIKQNVSEEIHLKP
ncbi:penicillin acylase family protein [Pseudemcibacter aquimaris]|uniref:penicillin acylase family protein n=1 Tax=Pseudemcibacter aquimaris TaxID=2857064 RepID=UPI002011E585|nr:penicillin acylase family protein [Pseudemcibacter aquimaris]MCC3859824.1 penicillin acylase family protein [Pseudemcibacter aquimaris]WDU57156.1 penicillin acylase family protein [Pseudemcibacter aquimaris]